MSGASVDCADPAPCTCSRCSGDPHALRYTTAAAGEGECQVSLEGGLVLLRPCPRALPGNGRAAPAVVFVAELDVRLSRDASEAGAWWVTDLDGIRPPGRLIGVPEPAPWAMAPAARAS